jgi:hypothetical protein
MLRAGRSVVRIQKGTNFFSLLHKRTDWLWGLPRSLPHGYNTVFFLILLRAKLSGGEFDYLHPSSAEFEGSLLPLPYMSSRGGEG